jgi:hypothetical protein
MSMSCVARSITVLFVALACSCGGAQPEPAVPDNAAPDPGEKVEPAPSAPDMTEPATPSGPTEPYATLLDIKPGKDDPADRRAQVEFFNPTNQSCDFKGYTLRWGDSSKEMPLDNVKIAAGNSRQRFLVVHPSDGDIESLSVEGATIELQVKCGP